MTLDYLFLFWTFFKIGLFSFGGGLGTIPLIKTELVDKGFIEEELFYNFIGIAESTPGPFAVNIATFVGSDMLGFFGSVVATLGVVLPAFIIILIITTLIKNFAKNKWAKGFMQGVQPFVVGLIISAGVVLVLKAGWVNYGDFESGVNIDIPSLIVTAVILIGAIGYKYIFKKNCPIIPLILVSAVIGVIFL